MALLKKKERKNEKEPRPFQYQSCEEFERHS